MILFFYYGDFMKKRVKDSITEQVHIIAPSDLNGYKRLFGGQLMQWIDTVAGVTARRHCEKNITTAMVDSLHFKAAAHANDLIVLIGKVTYTGKTSMEICVHSYIEEPNGIRKLINTAYFVMVALDEEEKPSKVPQIILETEEEKTEYEFAKMRQTLRKSRRNGDFYLNE